MAPFRRRSAAADQAAGAALLLIEEALAAERRYDATGDEGDLELVISMWRNLVGLAAERPAAFGGLTAMCFSRLGLALSDRSTLKGRPEDLDEAISSYEEAARLATPGDDVRVSVLNNLSVALRNRWRAGGEATDLDRAIENAQLLVALTPPGTPTRAKAINNLGFALRARAELTGNLSEAGAAVSAHEESVAVTGLGTPDTARFLNQLGDSLTLQGVMGDDPHLLERAEEVFELALEQAGSHEGDRSHALDGLREARAVRNRSADADWRATSIRSLRALDEKAAAALARFEQTGEPDALDELVSARHAIVDHAAFPHLDPSARAESLRRLAAGYLLRATVRGASSDLDAAVTASEGAVATDAGTERAVADRATMAAILQERYLRTQDSTDLARSIELLEEAAAQASRRPPEQIEQVAVTLGRGLLLRYRLTHDNGDLIAAIDTLGEAAARIPDVSPMGHMCRSVLGQALLESYKTTHTPSDLVRAMTLLTPTPGEPSVGAGRRREIRDIVTILHREAVDAEERFLRGGSRADLDLAVAAWRQVAELTHENEGFEEAADVIGLNRLGWALLERYDATRDDDDLSEAIGCFEEALRRAPPAYGDLATVLGNLAVALRSRNVITGDIRDLDRAVELVSRAVSLTHHGDPEHPSRRMHLAVARLERSIAAGEVDEETCLTAGLAQMVSAGEHAADVHAKASSAILSTLAQRFERSGDPRDLQRAISVAQRVLGPASAADSLRLRVVTSWLRRRYEISGAEAYLDAAIQLLEDAYPATAEGTADRHLLADGLALALSARYDNSGDAVDLERTIQTLEELVALDPDPGHFTNLGTSLRDRYRVSGTVEDLDRAIAFHLKAVETASAPSEQAVSLNALGNALRDRYERIGEVHNLDEAISAYETAMTHVDTETLRATLLTNLANGLGDRYDRHGALADLARSVSLLEEALAATPADSPKWWLRADNLVTSLHRRHRRSGDRSDLDRAVELSQRVIDRVPQSAPARPRMLQHFADGLLARYEATVDPLDLDTAISVLEDACRRAIPGSAFRAGLLFDLAKAVETRYAHAGDAADLDRALKLVRASLDLQPHGSPYRARVLAALGDVLQKVYRRTSSRDDLTATLEAYRSASDFREDPRAVLAAGREWGALASEQTLWEEAAAAYRRALVSAEELFRAQVLRTHKEAEVRLHAGMAPRAAFALAAAGDERGAVTALERGRALLLSEVLERGSADVERLRHGPRPDLYDSYRRAAVRVSGLEQSELGAHPTASVGHRTELLQGARGDLERVIAEVREVPGFERFLEPPSFEDVLAAASDEPLAYLAPAERGGVGFVVDAGGQVDKFEIPGMTEEEVRQAVLRYLAAYYGAPDSWPGALERTTRELWDLVMAPLLAALGPRQRVTLLPMGLLGLLPLAAAWVDDWTTPTQRRYALDTVTITYAPNARAVTRTRTARSAPDGLLAIDDPTNSLRYAAREVEAARATFRSGQVLRDATPQAVLEVLPDFGTWHFACHGLSNPTDPLSSGLVLRGGEMLTLREILRHPDLRARLAVLSACETALPGLTLPDEVVSLPTAFVQAGAAAVIGSLWRVDDASTALLMAQFYDVWRTGEGLGPADALRRAQQWVRDSTNGEKANAFPAIVSLTQEASPSARAFWSAARSHSHPQYWAAFTCVG